MKKKHKNRKSHSNIIALAVMIGILLVAVFVIATIQNDGQAVQLQQTQSPEIIEEQQVIEKLEQQKLESEVANGRIIEYIQPYYEKNNDTIGYIKINDTPIDYPVVYSGNNEFYLTRNFEKEIADEGAIFMDYRCDFQDFSITKNVILYGHRMKDGSMFKELTEYMDEDFYQTHKIFSFDTLYQQYECEVFAVFKTNVDFYYINTDFNTDEEWIDFMKKCHRLSIYQQDIKFYATDIVLTLSTCAIKKDERIVVMARLK